MTPASSAPGDGACRSRAGLADAGRKRSETRHSTVTRPDQGSGTLLLGACAEGRGERGGRLCLVSRRGRGAGGGTGGPQGVCAGAHVGEMGPARGCRCRCPPLGGALTGRPPACPSPCPSASPPAPLPHNALLTLERSGKREKHGGESRKSPQTPGPERVPFLAWSQREEASPALSGGRGAPPAWGPGLPPAWRPVAMAMGTPSAFGGSSEHLP